MPEGKVITNLSIVPYVWTNWFTSTAYDVPRGETANINLSFSQDPDTPLPGAYRVQIIFFDGNQNIMWDQTITDDMDIQVPIGSYLNSPSTWSSISLRLMSLSNPETIFMEAGLADNFMPNPYQDSIKIPDERDRLNNVRFSPQDDTELPSWLSPIVGMQVGNGSIFFPPGGGGMEPLILDLDGNGAHTTKLGWVEGQSTTYFDMDNDGLNAI